MVRLSDQFSRMKTAYSARNGAPTKADRGAFSTPVCVKTEGNGPASADQGFLQPTKTAAMCTVPRAETRQSPPIQPSLLAQNVFSKWIAPTDNMWAKLHDEYTHHQ